MTDAQHPLGLTSHPQWDAVREAREASAAQNAWLAQFVDSPSDIPEDDDHNEIEDEGCRPSFLLFALAMVLIVASIFASILPSALA